MAAVRNQLLASVRSVLVIRTGDVGDMILSTPAIRNIREGLPSAHIDLLASPLNASVLNGWEYIDSLLVYDRQWPCARRQYAVRRMRAREYDLCIVLSPSTESHRLAFGIRAGIRAGIVHSGPISRIVGPSLLTHPLVVDAAATMHHGEQVPHEVDQTLRLLKAIGLPAKDYPLEVPVSRADISWAQDTISANCSGHIPIGLHLSKQWFSHGWSGLGMALLMDEILRAVPGSSIIATCGPVDKPVAEEMASYANDDDRIGLAQSLRGRLLVAGDLSFGQWAALTSACKAVLTRDTGSLHLAAALRRPVLAIYDKHNFQCDAQRRAPWKVPHYCMESGFFSETSTEILRRLTALLAESSGKAA